MDSGPRHSAAQTRVNALLAAPRNDNQGVIELRMPACSTDGSGADVTGCVGAAAGFWCCALWPRRIEARVTDPVASDGGAIEACRVSRPAPRRTNSQWAK